MAYRSKHGNYFELPLGLAAKIGSIIVHADEALSDRGHPFDLDAIKPLLNDDDVRAFCDELGPLVPRKRSKDFAPVSDVGCGDSYAKVASDADIANETAIDTRAKGKRRR